VATLVDVDILIYIGVWGSNFSGHAMAININNPEADKLTRKFAELAGVGITDAIVIAMKEAIERRRNGETPMETAARLREKFGVSNDRQSQIPLPKAVFDDLWDDA